MKLSLCSAYGVLVSATLLFVQSALADGATTIPQFDADIAAARSAASNGGVAVTRAEMRGAINRFIGDDSTIDAAERAHLGAKLADASFRSNVNGQALKYAQDTLELNQDGAVPSISFAQITATTEALFGAAGALSNAAAPQEGFVPNGAGVATQRVLLQGYLDGFNAVSGVFIPVNFSELRARLGERTVSGQPSDDEADGALAYLNQIARNSGRLYLASWKSPGRGAPGDLGGYVVAAVSSDRRFVRMVEVTTWVE
jgi:hypothetical protein